MFDTGISHTLLTPKELATLGGAVTTVFILTNTLRSIFRWNPKFIGLLFSFLVAFFGVWVLEDHSAQAWVIAIPNAALIYSSATGMASITDRADTLLKSNKHAVTERHPEEILISRSFWRSWFS